MSIPRFTHPAFGEHTFDAVGYGPDWNGWATPVVTRATLEDLLSRLDSEHLRGWVDGEDVLRIEYFDGRGVPSMLDQLSPEVDGTYDLGSLAWTFERASDAVVIEDYDDLALAPTAADLDYGM